MAVAWHPTRWWDWRLPENENKKKKKKKEIDPIFTYKD